MRALATDSRPDWKCGYQGIKQSWKGRLGRIKIFIHQLHLQLVYPCMVVSYAYDLLPTLFFPAKSSIYTYCANTFNFDYHIINLSWFD